MGALIHTTHTIRTFRLPLSSLFRLPLRVTGIPNSHCNLQPTVVVVMDPVDDVGQPEMPVACVPTSAAHLVREKKRVASWIHDNPKRKGTVFFRWHEEELLRLRAMHKRRVAIVSIHVLLPEGTALSDEPDLKEKKEALKQVLEQRNVALADRKSVV